MRDFLPADIRKRNYVIGIIKEVYESYGFEPLETPAVENLETLTGKYGEEGNQLIFRILKRGEKLDPSRTGLSPAVRQVLEKSAKMSIYGKSLLSAVQDAFQAGEIEEDDLEAVNDVTKLFVEAVGNYRETHLSDLALRYDLTVPLARVVANYREKLPKFFKRYQIQPVWRADRPARGRFREFYQCDVDVIGSESIVAEAELIGALNQILEILGFDDFIIRLNHRGILNAMLEAIEIPLNRRAECLVILDKGDKIGAEGVVKEFAAIGLVKNFEPIAKFIGKIRHFREGMFRHLDQGKISANEFSWQPYNDFVRHELTKLVGNVDDRGGIKQVAEILSLPISVTGGRIEFAPVLARGLSYYTGCIMEIVLSDTDFPVSLAGGGRYDGLIGMFGKEQIPACGFSLGLERILVVMDERNMFPAEVAATSADVMVTIWNEETIAESLKLASELRQQGLRVTVYPEADKLGKQFKYAAQINVPYVCVLGDSEIAENKVTLKNMASGEQKPVARDKVADEIKSPTV